ncbi:hypothetical protein CERSUDRAFT_112384 [Gelatoporia subvermispora B]|uniref:Uncharacterized protein n=1 Tax=Ceriporiopsis subvermispora (strain B) TaxID=914234 RepID=M2QT08_CERS8|nr:hypothetical protein CERSUDRAFT_112384 [Gelatoporia subvermispora B]
MATMEISFDSTWCPVCSRQIVPKRMLVPVAPPQPAATPAPPPSSPSSEPKKQPADAPAGAPAVRRAKTVRPRGGLVHGTGRVRPNGTLKRVDSAKESSKRTPPPAPVAAAVATTTTATAAPQPPRMRTVIDQTPAPLYCSDECRLEDLQNSQGGLDIKFDPRRCASPILPPVPPNSVSDVSGPEDTDSSSGASVESRMGLVSPVSATASTLAPAPSATSAPSIAAPAPGGDKYASRAYAALQALYDLPPPPPPPPLLPEPEVSKDTRPRNDYQSGIMMAAQRIRAALFTEPPKKSGLFSPTCAPTPTVERPIPGWTDGSHAWRASVYSLANPNEVPLPGEEGQLPRAYRGFVASPHRARGVHSTLSADADDFPTLQRIASAPPKVPRVQSDTAELYSKFHATLSRRCESRASLQYAAPSTSPTGSTRSLPQSHREVPLVKPGAEGRLLVPDVKMRRTSSTASVDGARSPLSYSTLLAGPATRRKRSPLSRQGSAASFATSASGSARSAGGSVDTIGEEEDETVRVRPSRSAPIRTRMSQTAPPAWSYSDTLTYEIMPTPPQKRIERRIVDGVEVEVEVEVDVNEPRKRLFLFPSREEVDMIKPRRRHHN